MEPEDIPFEIVQDYEHIRNRFCDEMKDIYDGFKERYN